MKIEDYIELNSKPKSYVRVYDICNNLIIEKEYTGLYDITFKAS